MPTLQNVLDALKLAPRYLAAIGLFAGLLLFAPNGISDTLGIRNLTQNYRQWIGLAFLASITLLAVHWGVQIGGIVRNRSRLQKSKQRITKKLHSLTEDEKQILRFYYATQSKSNTLRIDDGVVNGLVSAGVIFPAARMGNMFEGFAHNISDVAWNYLHEHPELLDGTTNFYRTDKGNRRLLG
ncbi:superinfection exclusion B family protein [Neorhodopirellula pilleata]|uniref:superinfection exclusion B family protein n=1 Tax=Neorhodopirellula pilleata TaxID=2714738 RepID=UPI0011B57EAA|nr:superinfection exclusion B family protein [Neorhodopirellula pilleata]